MNKNITFGVDFMSSVYYFMGQKFGEYIDIDSLREKLQVETGFDTEKLPLGDFYEKFLEKHSNKREVLDRLFFESILYGKLKNVFVDRIKTNTRIDVEVFKRRMGTFIKNLNSEKSVHLDQYMSVEGFYLMDALNITKVGSLYLTGFDFTEDKDKKVEKARFLFVQVVPLKNNTVGYFIAGVEINFSENLILTLIRNITTQIKRDYQEDDEGFEKNWEESLNNYYYLIKKLVLNNLGITTLVEKEEDRNDEESDFYYKKDRRAMYKMCRELDEKVLGEFRQELERKFEESTDSVIESLFKKLFSPTQIVLPKYKTEFKEKLDSLLLSTLINVMADDEDIVDVAKEKKLLGFPTKISFTSDSAEKGSTGTSGKDSPVSGSGMFHSLYTDFKEALELPYWSISWFTDIRHTSSSDISVVPSTIESRVKLFRVTFKNNTYLNKELIYHVVGNINRYRCREDN